MIRDPRKIKGSETLTPPNGLGISAAVVLKVWGQLIFLVFLCDPLFGLFRAWVFLFTICICPSSLLLPFHHYDQIANHTIPPKWVRECKYHGGQQGNTMIGRGWTFASLNSRESTTSTPSRGQQKKHRASSNSHPGRSTRSA